MAQDFSKAKAKAKAKANYKRDLSLATKKAHLKDGPYNTIKRIS